MNLYKYLVLVALASFVFAMPNIDGTTGVIRSISADNGSAGTFNLGWYVRGFYENRIATALGDSISILYADRNAQYKGYDIGLYMGYALTNWLSLNASGTFYSDIIDYTGVDIIRSSNGFGDTKLGAKIGLGSSCLKYGLYGFFSFPTGVKCETTLNTSDNANYKNSGGVFRYFTSGATDWGLVGLFTIKSNIINLDLNLGYVDRNKNEAAAGYRNNYSIYNAALSFGSGRIMPFIEFSDIDFGGKNEIFGFADDAVFGPNQVYLTPGLNVRPGNLNIKLAVDIRVLEKENTRDFPTTLTDSFNITTGWGVAPPWAVILGFSYNHDFIPEKPKFGEIIGKVIDRETEKPVEANVGIYSENTLIQSAGSAADGSFTFTKLKPNIYKLRAGATDYNRYEVDLLVKVGEKTPISIALQPIPKQGVLILNIIDIQSKEPMAAKVTIGDIAPERAVGKLTKNLAPGSYPVKVVAEPENYLPYEKVVTINAGKTLELEVTLVKKEFKIVLPQVYFETGKAEIKPESYPVLDDAVATIMTVFSGNPDIKIEIQGHTDSIGSDTYNLRLSQERTTSVFNYLVTKHGLDATRFIAQGYGESRPIASNQTLEGRTKNRRVEFVIIK